VGGAWQPVKGRRRVLGLYRAVVLTLYLMRRNESQAVAGELFGCSQSTRFAGDPQAASAVVPSDR
jgi:hypothetical protein